MVAQWTVTSHGYFWVLVRKSLGDGGVHRKGLDLSFSVILERNILEVEIVSPPPPRKCKKPKNLNLRTSVTL